MDHDVENETPLLLPSPHHYHEGCPGCLLERRKAAANGAPPKKELFFVALLVLCNTLPIASLFPFIYFMVRDFGIAKLDTQIASYAGYIGSAVMLGRFMTSAPWGMVADRYGRKPVIIFGSTSIVIFNTLFGFSTNFWMALTSRFLLGICNGMFGTVRAYASEICSEEHQALGLSMVGTMWGVGMIIGPAIGGYLAQPSEKYPTVFPSGSLFDRFSYALPCICISAFAVAGLVASFWIPETLHKHSIQVVTHNKNVQNDASDKSVDVGIEKVEEEVTKSETQAVKKSLWRNSGMVAAIFLNCLWAVHSMAYLEIFSLWAVSPEVYGGLGFSTSGVGDVLAVTGVTLLLFQLFLFPKLARFLGAIQTVRVPAALTTGLTAMYPLIASLSGITLWAVLISAAVVKNILSVSVFTGIFMLVNNSVVSAQRGAANGVSTSFMSLFQAVGPASAGTVFSWAEERTDAFFLPGMWMVFSILSALSLITLVSTFEPLLPHSLNNPSPEE